MAKSVKINGTTYQAVPSIQVPLSEGTGNATFYETSEATANAANTLAGVVGFGANGKFTGTMTAASVSQDSSSKVLTIS